MRINTEAHKQDISGHIWQLRTSKIDVKDVPAHARKANKMSGGIGPLILILATRWRWVNKYFFFFFFHWHYSPLWALACRTTSFHFFLSIANFLHLLTPSTWRPLSTSSFHPFLGLPFHLIPSSSWLKIFLGILSSSILSRWPNQLTLCPFIHFTIFSPLLIFSRSRFVLLFHSPFSYLGPNVLLNIFLSKISRVCSSFFINVYASAPYDTTGLIRS